MTSTFQLDLCSCQDEPNPGQRSFSSTVIVRTHTQFGPSTGPGPLKMSVIIVSYQTSGQSNLTAGRIAAAHGRLCGIRQVAR